MESPTKRSLASHILLQMQLAVMVREPGGREHYSGDPIRIGVRIETDGVIVGHYFALAELEEQVRLPLDPLMPAWVTRTSEAFIIGKLFHPNDVAGVIAEVESLQARESKELNHDKEC